MRSSPRGARLLVVDDEPVARQLVGDILVGAGYEIVEAGDGAEALDVVAREDIDLIVSDWRMPKIDGLELVEELRELEILAPPVIMLTSLGSPDMVVNALDAGAEDYVVKPVDRTELLARVRSALRADRVRVAAEQRALRAIAEAVARSLPPEEVMHLVARHAAAVHRVAAGAVARFEDERIAYVGRWAAGLAAESAFYGTVRRDSPLPSAVVARTGLPSRVDDLGDALPSLPDGALTAGVAAPITVAGDLWGAVILGAARAASIPTGTEERLAGFADLVSLAIENAEARDALTTRAGTDPLTGLSNRRVFFERLDGEIERARRHGRQVSLAVVDIDHFKAINDTYGHQAGDAVLRELSWRLLDAARSGDVVGRIGGEEFAWLLPETDSMEAWQAAERARASVSGEPFPGVGRVSISIGVCDLPRSNGPEDLFSKADAALYWAKSQGRDVVFLYSAEVMEVLSPEERERQFRRNQAFQGVRALARAVDGKDPSTRRHSERVAAIAESLALELGWTAAEAARLREAGLVHDVGKIAVPDDVLFKPERLNPTELARVQIHASLGADVVSDIFDAEQISWVRGHHERWDGRGYPDGLTREEAPEGARILHLADSFDVMTSERPYQEALGREAALAECRQLAGEQFWSRAVDALEVLMEDDRIAPDLFAAPEASGV
ncbi:MAG: diguanylate cyclase [Miltoncostaeaceae bacterium]